MSAICAKGEGRRGAYNKISTFLSHPFQEIQWIFVLLQNRHILELFCDGRKHLSVNGQMNG